MIQKFRYAVLEFLLPNTNETSLKSINEMKTLFIHKSALLVKAQAEVLFSLVVSRCLRSLTCMKTNLHEDFSGVPLGQTGLLLSVDQKLI